MHDWADIDPLLAAAREKTHGEVRVYMARCESPNPIYRQTTHFELLAMSEPQGVRITTVVGDEAVEDVLPVPRDPAREKWLEVETGQTTEERMADLHARIDRVAAEHALSVEQRLAALEAEVARMRHEREVERQAARLGM